MHFSTSTLAALVALCLSCVDSVLATPAPAGIRFEMSKRNETISGRDLAKRFDNARITFAEQGRILGACGSEYSDTDSIVSLSAFQYGRGEHCGEQVTIFFNGNSAVGTVGDECLGCPDGGLSLTPSLFSVLAPLDAGVILGSWDFDN